MSSSLIRQMVGDDLVRGSKSRGKKFKKELGTVLSQGRIAKAVPKTQPRKK